MIGRRTLQLQRWRVGSVKRIVTCSHYAAPAFSAGEASLVIKHLLPPIDKLSHNYSASTATPSYTDSTHAPNLELLALHGQVQAEEIHDNHYFDMMSATHFEPSKETGNMAPKSLATEGVASKVDRSDTPDFQVAGIAGIAGEKDMEEHAEKHQDGLSQEYPGPMLTFSDAPSKPAFDVLDPSPTPASETHSSVVWVTELPTHERSGPVFDPDELREIFPTELPPRAAQKSSFFSRMFKRSTKQTEDIEMGPQTSPKRQSPRHTLLPIKCHWSFLVGGWLFVMSCGAIAYWGVSEQLNQCGSDGREVDGAAHVVATMLKR